MTDRKASTLKKSSGQFSRRPGSGPGRRQWVEAVTRYDLLSLPGALAAIFLGGLLNRRLKGPSFVRAVHAALLVVGAALHDLLVRLPLGGPEKQ